MRIWLLEQLIPMACLLMALWRVFLVAWLWLGKGMIDPQTPSIIEGWISQWVYGICLSERQDSSIAIKVVSSSSTSMYSTTPLFSSPSKVVLSWKKAGCSLSRFYSTISSGRMLLPLSVRILISLLMGSRTSDTSTDISPILRNLSMASMKELGSEVQASQLPLMRMRVLPLESDRSMLMSNILEQGQVLMRSMTLVSSLRVSPCVILAMRARFLTMPMRWPSGVSEGQMMPKCVLCSSLSLVSFDPAFTWMDTLLRCDRVAKKLVSLFKICETPVLIGSPRLSFPQLPVVNEFLMALLIILSSKMRWMLLSMDFLRSCIFLRMILWALGRQLCLNWSTKSCRRSLPERSMRFLAKWSRSSSSPFPRQAVISFLAMQPRQQAFFLKVPSSTPM